ncbi:hypothetical protein NFI96_032408, partial [Prochilodus magdalenae]
LQVEVPERVMEGRNITLTCNTTCSLTVRPTFTWYRDGRRLSSSTDQLHLQPVSREHAGRYHCSAQDRNSTEVTLNVTYGPKNISASISPSGEIVEGSSVTLTCSSDADPPVDCTWFNGTSLVVRGETYTLKVSSVDSGGYRCRCSNGYIEKYSEAVSLNVLYPPRNISLSVSASDEILGGSSFTLTCHSDANPPVQNYTWFKVGGDSPVGSGHSYSPLQSGSYYCEAQNEYGSQKSAAVTVSVKGVQSVVLIAVLGVVVGCLLVVIAVLCLRYVCDRKMLHTMNINTDDVRLPSLNGVRLSRPIWAEENIYSNMTVTATTSDTSPLDPDPSNQDDALYASVVPRTANNPRNARGTDGEVRSASIQHRHDDMVEMSEGDGAQYASVRFTLHSYDPQTLEACPDDFTHILYMIIQAALLIPLTMTLTVHLLFLLFSSGAGAQNGWGVTYKPTSICAVKGSTVNMSCTYTHPSGYSVMKAFWITELPVTTGVDPPDLLDDLDYRGRVQYLGDKQHNTTLRLQNVTEKDQTIYYFRFLTNRPDGRWTGYDGVDLKVTGLQVEVPERVMEGGNVTLTCNTTCSLTVTPTFTWYRDGRRLSSSTDQLHLQPVSREDAGRYHCSVLDQNLHSPEVTLNVTYGPKSVSVSISPPGYLVEGSSVNLTCSSDANPPVQNYTWFKEGGDSPVGSGNRYSPLQSGSYYCVAQNEYGSQKSAAVTVKGELSMVLYVVAGVGLCGAAVLIGVVLLVWKRKKRAMEERDYQNPDPHAKDDTYAALDPRSRSSDDVYNTLTTVHSSPSDDLYTALDPQSRSPDYDTLAVSESTCTDQCLVAAGAGLQVEVPERVMEGGNVTLTCNTTCSPTDTPTFTWYRGEHGLSSSTDQLHLQPVSREDAGGYRCAVLDQNLHSPEVTLNVRYGPKNVSVSISPPGYIVEGSSVNLTCSSDANPPVQNYTWYKEGGDSPVGSGHSYSPLQSGSYYCVAQNEYGSQKSAAVTVKGITGRSEEELQLMTQTKHRLLAVIKLYASLGDVVSSVHHFPLQENLYSSVTKRSTTGGATPDPDPSNQDDVCYASVKHHKVNNPGNAESSAGAASTLNTNEDVQYASVCFTHTGATSRSATSTLGDDSSAIYSSVR